MTKSNHIVGLVIVLQLVACEPEKKETATTGNVFVLVGESVAPVVILQAQEFMRLYQKNGAVVTYFLVPSDSAVYRFVHDTVRMILATRPLTLQERELAEKTGRKFLEITVAYDGLLAVVHHKNAVEQITVDEIRKILTGSITRWEQLSKSGKSRGTMKILLQDSSDETSYLRQRILNGKQITARFSRMPSALRTLQQVVKDPLSIGFVSSSWLDSAKVPAKVLEVAASAGDADTTFKPPVESVGKFYSPHPANIYRNYYPMKRGIYMYTRSLFGDVGSGFGTYVANKEGQRIFLDHGLVPGTQPIRLKRPE